MVNKIVFSALLLCAFALVGGVEKKPIVHDCKPATKYYDCIYKNVIARTVPDVDKLLFSAKTYQEKGIAFQQSSMIAFPKIFEKFSALELLAVDDSGIQSISSNTFTNAKKLKELFMYDNKITALNSNAFNGAKDLQILSLYNNSIKTIDDNAFNGLTNLQDLFLDNNELERLPMKTFAGLKNLQVLEIESNKLVEINDHQFDNNFALSELNLTGNVIKKFDMSQLVKLSNLNFVDLTNNSLDTILITKYVNSLNASHNQIKSIILDEGTKFEIVELFLSENKITDLQNLTKLDQLEELRLCCNDISVLDFKLFSTMKELRILTLQRNKLASIENSMAEKHQKLSFLDISHNKLTFLDLEILNSFPNLNTIKLNGNSLIELGFENVKQHFARLTFMSIEDNDWECGRLQKLTTDFDTKYKIKYLDGSQDCKSAEKVKNICCSKVQNPLKQRLVDSQKEALTLKKNIKKIMEDHVILENFNSQISNEIEERIKTVPALASNSDDKVTKLNKYFKYLEDENNNCKTVITAKGTEIENLSNNVKKSASDNNILEKQAKALNDELEASKAAAKTLKEENDKLKNQVKLMSDPRYKLKHDAVIH